MFFSKILAVAALALAPLVSAQQTRLQFTSVPGPFVIGEKAVIRWTGGNSDQSVTLILREGTDTNNLNTIGIIASNVKGNNYTWTPASSLKPGDDYALQITQGLDGNNYSGLFSILSASEGAATTIFAAAGSSTIAVATITPNLTSTSTVTIRAGSGTGTGTNVPRNTTMVSPTLSTSATITSSVTTSTAGAANPSSTTGGAIAAVSAKAVMGLGALAAAAMYLL